MSVAHTANAPWIGLPGGTTYAKASTAACAWARNMSGALVVVAISGRTAAGYHGITYAPVSRKASPAVPPPTASGCARALRMTGQATATAQSNAMTAITCVAEVRCRTHRHTDARLTAPAASTARRAARRRPKARYATSVVT